MIKLNKITIVLILITIININQASSQDKYLYGWGLNLSGQLGKNLSEYILNPVQIDKSDNWNSITAGIVNNFILQPDGNLWIIGFNDAGVFTSGKLTNLDTLTKTSYNFKVKHFSSRGFSFSAIDFDNNLWVWGDNSRGNLGLGDVEFFDKPKKLNNIKVKFVYNYIYRTIIITEDGRLMGAGENYEGTLGIEGANQINEFTFIGLDSNWVSITCGYKHSIGIKNDGSLWAWGKGDVGQLGLGDEIYLSTKPTQIGKDNDWSSVSSSRNSTIAMKKDGSLWAWGENFNNHLGIDAPKDSIHSSYFNPIRVNYENDWKKVLLAEWNVMALKNDRSLWAWGLNEGYLGVGDKLFREKPTQIGNDFDWIDVDGSFNHYIALKASPIVSVEREYSNKNDFEFINERNMNININFKNVNSNNIKIYNLLGEIVYEINNNSQQNININIENYLNGVYFINIENQNGFTNYKFIKY